MPSKSKLSEYSFSARVEFDRCESCFRTAQSIVLLKLVCVFTLFLLIFGLDIWKIQTHNTVILALILLLDITALIALAIGIRGVALEKRLFIVIFVIMFVLLTIAHSILFNCRYRGISVFNLILDIFITLISIVFLSVYIWFDSVKPSDYKQLRLEAVARAQIEAEDKDEMA